MDCLTKYITIIISLLTILLVRWLNTIFYKICSYLRQPIENGAPSSASTGSSANSSQPAKLAPAMDMMSEMARKLQSRKVKAECAVSTSLRTRQIIWVHDEWTNLMRGFRFNCRLRNLVKKSVKYCKLFASHTSRLTY